jgi:hypothetical protein
MKGVDMFTIQFEAVDGTHKLQDFDSKSRPKLVQHLSRFDRPIMAVYEGSTPITNWARTALRSHAGHLSRAARDFASSMIRA